MATAAVAQWQHTGPHDAAYHESHDAQAAQAAAAAAAAAAASAAAAAEAHARAQAEQRTHILSQPISQPSDDVVDETGKSTRPSNSNEFDPFYGRRTISELCERVIASLFECSLDSTATSFGAKGCDQRPTHRLSEFIAYALYRTRLPIQVTYQALYLLKRLKSRYPGARGSSGHRLFISALMLASKSTCDDTYSNKSWTIVGQGLFTLREVNQMERELFSYLGYRVNVANEALHNFIDGLESGRFQTTADLLACNSVAQQQVISSAEMATAPAPAAVEAASQDEMHASCSPSDNSAAFAPESEPAQDVSPVHVSQHEVSMVQEEAVSIEPQSQATASATATPVERVNSVYMPRSRSPYSFQQMQRASIAGYPVANYGTAAAAMSASMSSTGVPSYMQTNSAPATCSTPMRNIANGSSSNTSTAAFDSRPTSAHSHFRILPSARERSRPYTMPPQNANLHPHPYAQQAYAAGPNEHLQTPSSSRPGEAGGLSQYYNANGNEYLSAAPQARSPSSRSAFSSMSSSGSSYAYSDTSTSTSPSLYESRSQSSGYTTPETSEMDLASPGQIDGVSSAYVPAQQGACYTGKTNFSFDYLRSHPAFMALQQKDNAYLQQHRAADGSYPSLSN